MPAPQPPSERLDARSDAPLVIVARVALRIFSSHALRPAGAKGEACHSVDGALGGIQRSCVGIQGVSKRRHEAHVALAPARGIAHRDNCRTAPTVGAQGKGRTLSWLGRAAKGAKSFAAQAEGKAAQAEGSEG